MEKHRALLLGLFLLLLAVDWSLADLQGNVKGNGKGELDPKLVNKSNQPTKDDEENKSGGNEVSKNNKPTKDGEEGEPEVNKNGKPKEVVDGGSQKSDSGGQLGANGTHDVGKGEDGAQKSKKVKTAGGDKKKEDSGEGAESKSKDVGPDKASEGGSKGHLPSNDGGSKDPVPGSERGMKDNPPSDGGGLKNNLPGNGRGSKDPVPGGEGGSKDSVPGIEGGSKDNVPGDGGVSKDNVPGDGGGSKDHVTGDGGGSKDPLPKDEETNNECDPSVKCMMPKAKLVACLRQTGHESPVLSLSLENNGKEALDIKISGPDFVQPNNQTIQVKGNKKQEVNMMVETTDGRGISMILLEAANENCPLNITDLIAHISEKKLDSSHKSFANFLSRTPTVAVISLAALLILVSGWTCFSFRKKLLSKNWAKYQRLEMELPVSGVVKTEPESNDGWDNNWGDDWGDEEAPLTPSAPIAPSLSSKGLASRRLNKDRWKD